MARERLLDDKRVLRATDTSVARNEMVSAAEWSAHDLAWQSLHMRLLLPAGVALLQEELVAVTTK